MSVANVVVMIVNFTTVSAALPFSFGDRMTENLQDEDYFNGFVALYAHNHT